jgi:hypothetical protein
MSLPPRVVRTVADNVIPFPPPELRPTLTTPEGDTPLECSGCGEQWYALVPARSDLPMMPWSAHHGAVAMNVNGRITGYYGVPTCTSCGTAVPQHVAAAVLADADARRAAAGEVVVPRMQVETLMSVAEEHAPRLTRATRADITAALAAPTPKETDR